MSTNIQHLTDDSFADAVEKSTGPILVDFWAEWCGPCKALAPKLEELSQTYQGKVKIAKVNVDDNQAVPARLGIRGIPTLILFKDGKIVDKLVGNHPSEAIDALIQRALKG